MHANTASISSSKTQMSIALSSARQSSEKMRADHGDRSYSVRDVIIGMINKSDDKRTVMMSPGIAKRILSDANFPQQRKITDDRLYDATRSIKDGTWNPHHVVHFVLLSDGAFWLVNGQTRMTAIVQCDIAQKIGIIIQRVKDEHEARMVYTQFDKSAGVRTPGQILSAAGVSEEHGLPRQLATYLYSAVGIINNGMKVPSGSTSDGRSVASRNTANKLQWIGEWTREAKLYHQEISECLPHIKRVMMRGGTLAVALVTYRYQLEKAREFWRAVAEGANLKKNDPRLTLSHDLSHRNNAVGIHNISVQQSALAWNAFYQGRDLKILKCTPDWRLFIAGTPYGKAIK